MNTWGSGTWGSASAVSALNQLRTWTHDNFGENLIINVRGGGIYRWVEDNGTSVRALELSGVSGANLVPTVGLQVITSETDRHLIVLGADPISGSSRTGVADPMLVAFSSSEQDLVFEPLATNSAGDVRLSSGSFIVGGLKSRQEILIWTDTSLYSMNFYRASAHFCREPHQRGVGIDQSEGRGQRTERRVFCEQNRLLFLTTALCKSCPAQFRSMSLTILI